MGKSKMNNQGRKIIFSVAGIVGVMLVAIVLSFIPYVKIYQRAHYATYLPLFINVGSDLVLSIMFGWAVWSMLVQNPADKIAPIVMLILGSLGLMLVPLYVLAGFYMNAPWLGIVNEHPVTIICSLFIVFGIVGLLTRSKAKQPPIK